jgi:LacI family transcriptional regulator
MASIRDIARRAKVSVGTVSNYLNNPDRLAKSTREKIRRAIEALGYYPRTAARSLATSRSQIIALIVPDVHGGFFSQLFYGAEQAGRRNNYQIMICSTRSAARDDLLNRLLRERTVDGLILLGGSEMDLTSVRSLSKQGFPFVLINQLEDHLSSVSVDNFKGAYQAVTHLIGHGYREIALVSTPIGKDGRKKRRQAYEQALLNHGLVSDPTLIFEAANFTQPAAEAVVTQILECPTRPRAIFAMNDQFGIDVMQLLQARGLSIPHDIAIVGFDDVELARYVTPPLTTVQQPIERMGVRAAEILISHIRKPDREPEIIWLETELRVRRSCGC